MKLPQKFPKPFEWGLDMTVHDVHNLHTTYDKEADVLCKLCGTTSLGLTLPTSKYPHLAFMIWLPELRTESPIFEIFRAVIKHYNCKTFTANLSIRSKYDPTYTFYYANYKLRDGMLTDNVVKDGADAHGLVDRVFITKDEMAIVKGYSYGTWYAITGTLLACKEKLALETRVISLDLNGRSKSIWLP